jgi:hypothetical protein
MLPFAAGACGRVGYDRLAVGLDAGSTDRAGFGGAGGAGGTDASRSDVGSADLGTPGDSGAAPGGCNQAGAPIMVWPFDTGVDGWELSGTGTMVWNGTVGSPAPGALQVDWGGSSAVHPRLVQALGDLRGRIATFRVWVDSGAGVTVKPFVQTSQRLDWADGGVYMPAAQQWTCVSIDLDNPAFSKTQYDPSDVQIIGLELDATSAVRLYVDEAAY